MENSLYFIDRITSILRVIYDVYISDTVTSLACTHTNFNNDDKFLKLSFDDYEVIDDNDKKVDQSKHLKPLKRRYLKSYTISDYFGPLYKPTLIIDNIYVGSSFNAASTALIHEFNFKYIINVTTNVPNYHKDVTYFNIPIEDNNNDLIDKYLLDVYNKILEFKSNDDGNILIHCFVGASRSVSVALFYLMKNKEMNLEDALTFIKEKRYLVHPSETLLESLKHSSNL